MAIHIAIAFTLLCIAILCARPERSWIQALTGELNGSLMARRLLPVAIVCPPLLGWLVIWGWRKQLYDPAFAISLLVVAIVVIFMTIIWQSATFFNRVDDERRRVLKALHDANHRLTLTLESTTDGFFALDQHWQFIYVNRQAEHFLQKNRAELLNQNIWQVFPDVLNTQFYEQCQKTAVEKTPAEFEAFYPSLGLWAEVHTFPSLEGLVIYFKDISLAKRLETQRQQAEESIKASEERLRSFVDANVIGILFGDVEGGVQEANDELLRIVGYSREDLYAGRVQWVEITPPEYLPLDERGIAEAQSRGACTPYEKEYIRKDGSRVSVLVGYTLLGEERLEAVAFILDLTERKQMEEMLRQQKEELARANRTKDEFFAVLSHELRTPLNPILGWAKLLQTKKLDETKTLQALETIERNARLQASLVDDLLDVSRILQGKLELSITAVDLTAVIQAAIETVRLSAEAKSIDLQLSMTPQLPADFPSQPAFLVSGNFDRLQQVFWNLLSNAIKFTPSGGRVEVGVRSQEDSPGAEVKVTDTGKGIPSDFLPHVFDYFRQEDSSTTRSHGGLGLGLAIVKHLVELQGGTVSAASPGEGKGATFGVQLPLLKPESRMVEKLDGVEKPPSLSTPLAGVRILVVEDEIDNLEFLGFLLEQNGAVIRAAASGAEALQLFPQFKPDVLLSDIGMPEMNGYELMQQIRALPPDYGGRVRAIALTAHAGEGDQQQAVTAGFQRHLAKPVEPAQLIQAISEVVQP